MARKKHPFDDIFDKLYKDYQKDPDSWKKDLPLPGERKIPNKKKPLLNSKGGLISGKPKLAKKGY